jgi:UDP-N-acetyl-D-glucosamine dehydrogenase
MSAKTQVSIIGQGYVGFPLAVLLANSNFKVVGYDSNSNLVKNINMGFSHIEDISNEQVGEIVQHQSYRATSNYQDMEKSAVYIVCVPTPLDIDKKPDLSYLLDAVEKIAEIIRKGDLVIIESTVAPGTTRDLVLPKLVELSGLNENEFYLSFSPERIDPLNGLWNIKNTPKVVSGYSNAALEAAAEFYSKFIEQVVKVGSLEVAETSKLLENTYRLINISFINEIYMFCDNLGIDIEDVIKAAATKPYGFHAFYPSIGIGGHCIPVDPVYFAEKFRDFGLTPKFIDLALEINANMPKFITHKAKNILGNLTGKQILIIGVAYKPNVADTRETPVKKLIEILKIEGAKVFWHDDLVNEWNGEKSIPITSNCDLVIIHAYHEYINLDDLNKVPIISTSRLHR